MAKWSVHDFKRCNWNLNFLILLNYYCEGNKHCESQIYQKNRYFLEAKEANCDQYPLLSFLNSLLYSLIGGPA